MANYPVMYGNSYATSEKFANPVGKMLPNALFYPFMLATVYRSSRLSKADKLTNQAWVQSSLEIIQALERVGCKLTFENLHTFANVEGPCVVVANHMSTLETFALPAILQPHKDIAFVVKQSLAEYPFFRWVIKATDPVIVGRNNPREDLKTVLEEGTKRLEQGRSVVVFPQSTRSLTLDPQRFNTIGIKLARRASVPVVPLALKTDAWGIGNIIKDFGKVDPQKEIHFRFSKPLKIEGNGKEQHNQICQFISSSLKEWA